MDNNGVKIKQEVNLNLATKDKQKSSSTFETVGRKHYSCSRCGSKKHALMIKTVTRWKQKGNKCTLLGHYANFYKTKSARIEAEIAK